MSGIAPVFYAHTPPEGEPTGWHGLEDHLHAVAAMAGAFAQRACGPDDGSSGAHLEALAHYAGLVHDLGKYTDRFQGYLRECHVAAIAHRPAPRSDAPHSIHGAAIAARRGADLVALLAASHHAGLPNLADLKARLAPRAVEREGHGALDTVTTRAAERLRLPAAAPSLPECIAARPVRDQAIAMDLLARMLFSCLVDADWLDTERHFSADRYGLRLRQRASWREMWVCYERFCAAMIASAQDTPVNRARHEVYSACVAAGDGDPGAHRLTVPTGGGKTLAALGFALRHAMRHGLDRIIVAIPYTSIIDQTADIYRRVLGDANVLEHHSAIDPDASEGQQDTEARRRLLAENWDAPVVVTTTVQLFESLFASRPARCRKVHNIARSVLILDEVQTLPPHLLDPLLSGLGELAASYGVTPVLCTATQPALDAHLRPGIGLTGVREIVPGYRRHFEALRRVDYRIDREPATWSAIAGSVVEHEQALVVLNTRRDAIALLDAIGGGEHVFHLSTLLCGAHRRAVLSEVRRRLLQNEPCTLVSTQVIECGVDIDFPVAFRALAPLDRIAQTAGRCNREGARREPGVVHVFVPRDGTAPRGAYRTGIDEAAILLRDDDADLHDPDLYVRYFDILYKDVDTDRDKVQDARAALNFADVAERVRLIREDTVPVVVPYDEAAIAGPLEQARGMRSVPRNVWSALQAHTVSLYQHDFSSAQREGLVDEVADGLYRWLGSYDRVRGIGRDAPDPADLIA